MGKLMIIEDNLGDIDLINTALEINEISCATEIFQNSLDAWHFINAGADLPDLILLDLNLPRLNGIDLLKRIRSHANQKVKLLPVIILSTSQSQLDINEAYAAGANCFVSKPLDFKKFLVAIKDISRFWLETAAVPQYT